MAIEKNLVQRVLAGIVFLAVMIFCICYDERAASGLFMLLAIFGSFEFINLIHTKTDLGASRFLILGFQGILSVFSLLILCGLIISTLLPSIYIGLIIVSSAVLFLVKGENSQRLARVGTYLFGSIYVFGGFFILSVFGSMYWHSGFNFMVLYFFILIWMNDTFAYVVGRLIGKHKLAESISPKKTVEGFIGGLVFATAASVVAGIYWENQFSNPIMFWVCPVVVGVFATIGDLFESAIKRWAGVKDSGNIIPGHGGILDRFDGALIAVWPYLALLIVLNR